MKLRGDYHLTSDEVDTCILLTSAIIKGNLMCGDSLFGELHKWNATIWCDIPNNFDYLDVASIHEAQQVLFPDHIPFNYELFSVKKRGMATSGGSLRIRKARPYER